MPFTLRNVKLISNPLRMRIEKKQQVLFSWRQKTAVQDIFLCSEDMLDQFRATSFREPGDTKCLKARRTKKLKLQF